MNFQLRRRLQFILVGVITIAAIGTSAVVLHPFRMSPGQALPYSLRPRATGSDWDTYLGDTSNSGYNSKETTLSLQNMEHLRLVGMYDIGSTDEWTDAAATSVVSAGNTLYFGSWDGYEYAINATTFTLRWRQFLGITTPPLADQCFPLFLGVTSNATLVDNNLYVGGGNGVMYDLDPTTGTVIWQTRLATPPDEYLWSSPLVVHGHIYMGVSSYGDRPLIRGRIDMLDPDSGQILKVHYTVGPDEAGTSVWTKGVADPADDAVIFSTGNGPADSPESQIIALNWDTLHPLPNGVWSMPANELNDDADFGAACTFVPNVGGGRHGVVCHNKNGYIYALAVSPSGLALSWSESLGPGGDAPEHDMGDIAEVLFDGTYLYTATSQVTIHNETYQSAVYRINPATGTILWVSPISRFFSLNSLAGANGFLVMGLSDVNFRGAFLILDAATGKQVYQQILSSAEIAAPSIADGEILLPTLDGHLYIYADVDEPSATASLSNGTLPAGWQWLDNRSNMAALTPIGVQIRAAGGETVDTANFLARSLPVGDYTIEAPVDNPLQNGAARAGIVAYASPGNYVALSVYAVSPTRETFEMLNYFQGKLVNQSVIGDPVAGEGPVILQLVQTHDRFLGYSSRDGTHWLKVGDFYVPFSTILGGVSTYTPAAGMSLPATFAWCQITGLNGL